MRNKTKRRRNFFPALELIRIANAKDITYQSLDKKDSLSIEIKGQTNKGVLVGVHIREEREGKDRKLYLISTFKNEKPAYRTQVSTSGFSTFRRLEDIHIG